MDIMYYNNINNDNINNYCMRLKHKELMSRLRKIYTVHFWYSLKDKKN